MIIFLVYNSSLSWRKINEMIITIIFATKISENKQLNDYDVTQGPIILH